MVKPYGLFVKHLEFAYSGTNKYIAIQVFWLLVVSMSWYDLVSTYCTIFTAEAGSLLQINKVYFGVEGSTFLSLMIGAESLGFTVKVIKNVSS